MKGIGVIAVGEPCPGRNSIYYGISRKANQLDYSVKFYHDGFQGFIENQYIDGIQVERIQGQIGESTPLIRSNYSLTLDYRRLTRRLEENKLDALILVGDSHAFDMARELIRYGINCYCIPASSDAEVWCTEYSVGRDSIVNEAIRYISTLSRYDSADGCIFLTCWDGFSEYAHKVIRHMPISYILHSSSEFEMRKMLGCIREKERLTGKSEQIVLSTGIAAHNEYHVRGYIEQHLHVCCNSSQIGPLLKNARPSAIDIRIGIEFGTHTVELIHEEKRNRAIVFRESTVSNLDLQDIHCDILANQKILRQVPNQICIS